MRRASASSLDRVLNCLPSALGVDNPPESHEARTGHIVHRYLRLVEEKGQELALNLVADEFNLAPEDEDYQHCEAIPLNFIPTGGLKEATFAWSPAGGARFVGCDLERNYKAAGIADHEFPGTFDYVAQVGSEARVPDYKSGRWTKRARDNFQIAFGVFVVCEAYGLKEGKGAHVRVQRGRRPYWDVAEFDLFDLMAIKQRMVDLDDAYRRLEDMEQQARELVGVSEGEWCRFCRRYKRCPAKIGMIRELAKIGADRTFLGYMVSTEPDDAARALEALMRFEEVAAAARKQLENYAELYPLQLRTGEVFGPKEGRATDKVEDPAHVLNMLRGLIGTHAELAVSVTKGGIEEAAKAYARAQKLPIIRTVEGVVETLRRKMAIRKVPGAREVRLFTPEKALADAKSGGSYD